MWWTTIRHKYSHLWHYACRFFVWHGESNQKRRRCTWCTNLLEIASTCPCLTPCWSPSWVPWRWCCLGLHMLHPREWILNSWTEVKKQISYGFPEITFNWNQYSLNLRLLNYSTTYFSKKVSNTNRILKWACLQNRNEAHVKLHFWKSRIEYYLSLTQTSHYNWCSCRTPVTAVTPLSRSLHQWSKNSQLPIQSPTMRRTWCYTANGQRAG